MWLSKQMYLDMRDALAAAVAVRDTQASNIRALDVTCDWFRVRIAQLEHERAIMLSKYMGLDVPVVTIERAQTTKEPTPYNVVPHFNDMGDEEAKKLGIDWDPVTGSVNYNDYRGTV